MADGTIQNPIGKNEFGQYERRDAWTATDYLGNFQPGGQIDAFGSSCGKWTIGDSVVARAVISGNGWMTDGRWSQDGSMYCYAYYHLICFEQ